MQIVEVDSPTLRREFLGLPLRISGHHSLWIAPLRRDEKFAMSRSHPFYRHSEAQFFLAREKQRTIGRIAALHHSRWNQHRGRNDVLFTMFDCYDDPTAARGLIDAVDVWGQSRGATRLVGPIGMLPSDGNGILVEGFDHPPALGAGYHLPYYDTILSGAGLTKATDYLSGQLRVDHQLSPEILSAADTAAQRDGFEVRALRTRRALKVWVPRFRDIYNTTFRGNFEFSPIDEVDMAFLGKRVLRIADPKLLVLVTAGSEIAGYVIILPDVVDAVRRARGRLGPVAVARILRAVRTTRRVSIVGFGIMPQYRKTGANLVVYAALARRAAAHRFESAEVIHVDEGNTAMMRNMTDLGVPWTKRHRIYQKSL